MKKILYDKECSVVVSSCDAFSDVWESFFKLFFKYWPDCPFSIYLISETKKYPDERIININIGEDKKWASNMKVALKEIDTPYIIYLQEDYLLESKVDTKKVLELLEIIKKEKAAYLKLYPSPAPHKNFKDYIDIGEINKGGKYSISLQAAIWNKNILENIIIDGESGWDMEFKGSIRSKDIKEPFLSVHEKTLDYFYTTAIKKGVWFYDAVKLCEKEGIYIDPKSRPIETFGHCFIRRSGLLSMIQKIKRFAERIKKRLFLISMLPVNLQLLVEKNKQIKEFYSLRKKFFEFYDLITKKDISDFTTKHWDKLNNEFENHLRKNNIPFGFLRNRVIGYTMFVFSGGRAMETELKFLEENYNENELKKYLREEAVGLPIIMNKKYLTSHNSIRHLYHISRFLNKTKTNIDLLNSVIEWGGGYGNFAKIFSRIKNDSKNFTYTIIDTPIFSCIQWLYLSIVLGRDRINLIKQDNDNIVIGKINIIPLGFIDKVKEKPDLFVSTWALSESSVFSQNYVAKKDFYKAPHILIGHQDSSESLPYAGGIVNVVDGVRNNTIKESIDFIPGNYYIFK